MLRRMVSGEVVLVGSIVFAAGVLTSLPPPSRALGQIAKPLGRVGPGPVNRVVSQGATRAVVRLLPNTAVAPMSYGIDLSPAGAPVTGASVVARFSMLDMDMGTQAYALREIRPGRYRRNGMPLIMVGNCGVTFEVTPRRGAPYSFTLIDHANG